MQTFENALYADQTAGFTTHNSRKYIDVPYSHATDPTIAESQASFAPTFTLVSDSTNSNYLFTYQKPLNRPNAQYQVEKSASLVDWTPVTDALVSSILGVETRAASATSAPPQQQLFYRLHTTITP